MLLRPWAFGVPCSAILSALLLASCTRSEGEPAPATPGPSGDGGAADVEPEAGAACPPLGVTARASAVSVAPPRDHHVAFVHEAGGAAWLYVVGGARDEFTAFFDDVQRARIGADGELGAFEPAGTLPRKVAGMGLAVVGDRVVLTAGVLPTSQLTPGTLVGRLGADGLLGDWKEGPSVPMKVMHPSAVAVGRDVYVLGGTTGSAATSLSARAHLGEDGTLGAFVPTTPLEPKRSHQAAFVHDGRVYLAGGIDRGPSSNPDARDDVVSAPVGDDGALGAWSPAGTLPVALSVHPAEPLGCRVLVAGGLGNESRTSPFSDGVHTLALGPDGLVTETETVAAKLAVKRGHVHQLPRHGRHLYVVGGRVADGSSTGAIDILTLDRDP